MKRNPSRLGAGIALLPLFALAPMVGCQGLEDAINQGKSDRVLIGQLTATGDQAVAGQVIKGKVKATAYLGTRDLTQAANSGASNTLKGTASGNVRLEVDGKKFTLADKGGGTYSLASDEGGGAELTYKAGSTYTFIAEPDVYLYSVSVEAPPIEQVKEFHEGAFALDGGGLSLDGGLPNLDGGLGQFGFVAVKPGQNLALTRSAVASGQERAIGLVVVTPVDSTGPKQPSFTEPSIDVQSVLDLVLKPEKYKADTITVTGSKAWPTCTGDNFLVAVTGLRKGKIDTNNLSVGSTAFAGSADAAPVRCAP